MQTQTADAWKDGNVSKQQNEAGRVPDPTAAGHGRPDGQREWLVERSEIIITTACRIYVRAL